MSKQKNKPPRFHHYVPKTYLKHWLDDNNLIYIYNKKTGEIKASSIKGQYFGKNHLNTITYPNGTKGYWVEEAFAEAESKITPALDKVASSLLSNSKRITFEDKLALSLFVSIQFWRLPTNVDLVKSCIANGDFSSLCLSVVNQETGEKLQPYETVDYYRFIHTTDLFQKAYPVLRALLDMKKHGTYANLQYWSLYFQEPGYNLSSDNPIIYTKTPTIDSIFKNFILSLSPSVLMIATNRQPNILSSSTSINLNILQICHANQFVVGRDRAYLRSVADEYEKSFKTIPLKDIEDYVFKEIFETMNRDK